jgi:hypothetical protein
MSRGLLGEELLKELAVQLPDLTGLWDMMPGFDPGAVPMKFSHESSIPVASACLYDAIHSVGAAKYAFHEILAHQKWYLEKRASPLEDAATYYSVFYADDVALRLYAAGEHLANAITFMLELSKTDLDPHRKNRVSLQIVVGNYLRKERPDHPITKAVLKLMNSEEWRNMLNYRNDWVHGQPPLIKGMGIVYERRKRWQVVDSGVMLTFGGGDEPQLSVEDLISFIRPSLFLFVDVLTEVAQIYIEIIDEKGSVYV